MRSRVLALMTACTMITPAEAAHWRVNYDKSQLGFSVLWGKDVLNGRFRSWHATIDFDPADLAHSSADVAIDVASEVSDDDEIDASIGGEIGFAVDSFPTARFHTLSIVRHGSADYMARGTLTLKGVVRPVSLPFSLSFSGNSVHMKGLAHLDRTAFDVGSGEYAAPEPVAHDVTVKVDIVATRDNS